MKRYNLQNGLFLELDNLLYDDPRKWLPVFSKKNLSYMCDNVGRYSSGIMYVKNHTSIQGFLKEIIRYIQTSPSSEFLNEMTVLSNYYAKNKDTVQILPTFWRDKSVPPEMYQNYFDYNDTIFDAAAVGIYLLGQDPYHNKNTGHSTGKIVKFLKWNHSYIDCRKLKFKWDTDETGKRKPYIWNGEKWLLINNLHVHAKNLIEGLSLPMDHKKEVEQETLLCD
jgi:hypothetical protein